LHFYDTGGAFELLEQQIQGQKPSKLYISRSYKNSKQSEYLANLSKPKYTHLDEAEI